MKTQTISATLLFAVISTQSLAQGYAYTGPGTTTRSGVPMTPAYRPAPLPPMPAYSQSTMDHVARVERNPWTSAARDGAAALSNGRKAGQYAGTSLSAAGIGNAPVAVVCGAAAGYYGYNAAQSARWVDYALRVQSQQACLPLPRGLR